MSNHVRGVVRRLVNRWGTSILLKSPTGAERDLETGSVTRSYTIARIKALLLPVTLKRDFAYDLAFIAANNNFTYGGLYEREEIDVIFDSSRLTAFSLSKEVLVVVNNRPHVISRIANEWSGGYFYSLRVQRTDDVNLGRVGVTPAPSTAVADVN